QARDEGEDVLQPEISRGEGPLEALEALREEPEATRRDLTRGPEAAELLPELVGERDLRRPRQSAPARDLVDAVEAALRVRELLRQLPVLLRAAVHGGEELQ